MIVEIEDKFIEVEELKYVGNIQYDGHYHFRFSVNGWFHDSDSYTDKKECEEVRNKLINAMYKLHENK